MRALDPESIQNLVRQGHYLVKLHAFQHALKEGFGPEQIEAAILSGQIIEDYPAENRALVCGRAVLEDELVTFLHVVCELRASEQIDIITAYIPDPVEWEKPPFRRKRR